MHYILLIIIFTITVVVGACAMSGPIDRLTNETVKDRAQERQHREDWHRLELDKAQDLQGNVIESQRHLIWTLTLAVQAVIIAIACGLCLLTTKGTWIGLNWLDNLSQRIPLNPQTMQYPLLQYNFQGRTRVYDPNIRQLVDPDQGELPALPMLVEGSTATRLALIEQANPLVVKGGSS